MSAAAVRPVGEHQFLRLGERRIQFRRRRGRDLRFQPGSSLHRRTVPFSIRPPVGAWVLRLYPDAWMRGAVGDRGMAVDARQPDRPVADHCVEVGGGGKALVAPLFLVPAAAEDPARIGIGGGIGLQPLLNSDSDVVPVRSSCSAVKPRPMIWPWASIRPGSSVRPPASTSCWIGPLEILSRRSRPVRPVIAVDHQRAEMLKLPVGADLDAIDVVDHRVAVADTLVNHRVGEGGR